MAENDLKVLWLSKQLEAGNHLAQNEVEPDNHLDENDLDPYYYIAENNMDAGNQNTNNTMLDIIEPQPTSSAGISGKYELPGEFGEQADENGFDVDDCDNVVDEVQFIEHEYDYSSLHDLLGQWNLCHLSPLFIGIKTIIFLIFAFKQIILFPNITGNKITIDILVDLDRDHINKLFVKMPLGDQVRFEKQLKDWKPQQNNTQSTDAHDNTVQNVTKNPTASSKTSSLSSGQIVSKKYAIL